MLQCMGPQTVRHDWTTNNTGQVPVVLAESEALRDPALLPE